MLPWIKNGNMLLFEHTRRNHVLKTLWLMIRMFAGSYIAGATVASLAIGIVETLAFGFGWPSLLIPIAPLFAITGWLMVPEIPEHHRRERIMKVATGSLFVYYWACIGVLVIFREPAINISLFKLDPLFQFCFSSGIAGGFGTMFACTVLEDRLLGKKFSL